VTLPVMAERCATCIFRPGNLMHLAEGRLADIVRHNTAHDAHLVCHQDEEFIFAKDDGEEAVEALERPGVVCRGWYDQYDSRAIRLAKHWNLVEFVEGPPEPRGQLA